MNSYNHYIMSHSAKTTIEQMFVAFGEKDVDKILETYADGVVIIYHGTTVIPPAQLERKEGVRTFFEKIFQRTEVLHFEPKQFVVEGKMVVVLGHEHQRVKRSGRELKQNWVQIYTVEDNLITRMEEFAASEVVKE